MGATMTKEEENALVARVWMADRYGTPPKPKPAPPVMKVNPNTPKKMPKPSAPAPKNLENALALVRREGLEEGGQIAQGQRANIGWVLRNVDSSKLVCNAKLEIIGTGPEFHVSDIFHIDLQPGEEFTPIINIRAPGKE